MIVKMMAPASRIHQDNNFQFTKTLTIETRDPIIDTYATDCA